MHKRPMLERIPCHHPCRAAARLVDEDLEIQAGENRLHKHCDSGKATHRSRRASGRQRQEAMNTLRWDTGVHVEGSLISASTMHIGTDCRITGPVIASAESPLILEPGAASVRAPTTVSAPRIEIADGVTVFGTYGRGPKGTWSPSDEETSGPIVAGAFCFLALAAMVVSACLRHFSAGTDGLITLVPDGAGFSISGHSWARCRSEEACT